MDFSFAIGIQHANSWGIMGSTEKIREQILLALQHPEAEEGLYLENFYCLHAEDERPAVDGSREEVLEVLTLLEKEGVITTEMDGKDQVYRLP